VVYNEWGNLHITWIIIVLAGRRQADVYFFQIYKRHIMSIDDIIAGAGRNIREIPRLTVSEKRRNSAAPMKEIHRQPSPLPL
jgi:hypothetical protein